MRLPGFIGQAYAAKSTAVECQRLVNWYPEQIQSGSGKDGEVAYFLPTPGLSTILAIGNGPIRLVYVDPRNTIFVASGSSMYKLSYSGSIWSSTLLGVLSTSNGSLRAASNLLANGDCNTVFVDGAHSYTYEYVAATSAETFQDYTTRGYSEVAGATNVQFVDGFFVFNKPGTSQFFITVWGTFSVTPLTFASAEGDPDNLAGLIANKRYLWLLGEQSTEIFINTGNPDFPFERISGGFIEKGCIAPYSIAKIDGSIFWLGQDHSGQGIVYAAQGLTPQRISTHAIETAIQGYPIDSITNADAYTYSLGGHSFYVLNFPKATWAYDVTTQMWHERAYNNSGSLERHRASYHVFLPQYNFHLMGDYANNKVYKLDDSVYTDDGISIPRIRSSPYISASGKLVRHTKLEIFMEMGVGLSGGVQGSDPQLMLDWSDDGGKSWSNEISVSIGATGARNARAIFRRLGQARNRVYRVKLTDPVNAILMGADLDVEVGAS